VLKGISWDVLLLVAGLFVLVEALDHTGIISVMGSLGGGWCNRPCCVWGVGTLVTAFLSNDATAVVLTPAVYTATRSAGATPLPYLFVCAFIANAASFVLPISNPANLSGVTCRTLLRGSVNESRYS
jgi:arsenical pump membrane protein